jgi:hypothetical protein
MRLLVRIINLEERASRAGGAAAVALGVGYSVAARSRPMRASALTAGMSSWWP